MKHGSRRPDDHDRMRHGSGDDRGMADFFSCYFYGTEGNRRFNLLSGGYHDGGDWCGVEE